MISIRQEIEADFDDVFDVIFKAFEQVNHSDQSEPFLVNRIRKTKQFIPELSLVAIIDEEVIGHILLSKIKIQNEKNSYSTLALAPISVLPIYQNVGVGARLINAAHQIAKEAGYQSIILIGHKHYYPRFGYQPTENFDITFPFPVPRENGMAIELTEGALTHVKGVVVYPRAFFVS